MKRMYGESLNRILMHEGALPADEVAAVAMRVSGILHVVHAAGYVHRDIKPEHVLLERNRHGELEVSLLDFGVCAAETAPADERERERGRVFGTPTYVSPEQAAGIPEVDGRADIFGLGIVMFECLAGRVPFAASNVSALLRRIIREDAPRVMLCAPGVDVAMDSVVSRALARSPHERFSSARALMRALAPHAGDRAATEARLASRLRGRGADHVETATGDVVAA
jgi:serine/threonine-protein kinase